MNVIHEKRTQIRRGIVFQDTRTKRWGFRFQRKGITIFKSGYLCYEEATIARKLKELELGVGTMAKETRTKLTLRAGMDWFLTTHCSTLRRDYYKGQFKLAVDYFNRGRKREIKVSEVTADMIRDFLGNLSELRHEATPYIKAVTDHTVRHYHAGLRNFFNRLIKEGQWDGRNPALMVPLKKVQKPRLRFFFSQELLNLEQAFRRHAELWPYYVAALHTGCRIEELMNMQVKDVDLIQGQVFLPDSKNGRSRYVHLSPNMIEFTRGLMEGKAPASWLITKSDSRVERWGYEYLLRHFKLCCQAAGVVVKKGEAWHVLRHTFVQRLLAKGESIYKVSLLVGHSSVSVTQAHYGHLAAADLRDAVRKIDGVTTTTEMLQRSCNILNKLQHLDFSDNMKTVKLALNLKQLQI
jgi:integrase